MKETMHMLSPTDSQSHKVYSRQTLPKLRIAGAIGLVLVLLVCTVILPYVRANRWFLSYFSRYTPLTTAQKHLLTHSASILSSPVVEDAGVKVTLAAVAGNGYYAYYKVDVVLPESMHPGEGYRFEQQDLLINDNSVGLGSNGFSSVTLADGNPNDNSYSLLLAIGLKSYDHYEYSFSNGIIRTLQLENIITSDQDGHPAAEIQGQWNFSIRFLGNNQFVEWVKEPVTVSGTDIWDQSRYKAKVSSFLLSAFSAECTFEMSPDSSSGTLGAVPVIVMKDGRSYGLIPLSGSGKYYHYYLRVPVSLNEIAYLKLTKDISLPVNTDKGMA